MTRMVALFVGLVGLVALAGCAPAGGGGGGATPGEAQAHDGLGFEGFDVAYVSPDGAIECGLARNPVVLRCEPGAQLLTLVSQSRLTVGSEVWALTEDQTWEHTGATIGQICSTADADDIRWPLDTTQIQGEAYFYGTCDGWPTACDVNGPLEVLDAAFSKVIRVDRGAGTYTAAHCIGWTDYTTYGEIRPLRGGPADVKVCWDGETGQQTECGADCQGIVGTDRVSCR